MRLKKNMRYSEVIEVRHAQYGYQATRLEKGTGNEGKEQGS